MLNRLTALILNNTIGSTHSQIFVDSCQVKLQTPLNTCDIYFCLLRSTWIRVSGWESLNISHSSFTAEEEPQTSAQTEKKVATFSSHRCRRRPWSHTCRSISGKAGLGAASEPTGWRRTRPARRCWLWGTGSPGWLLRSALSLSQSRRWPATARSHDTDTAFTLLFSFFILFHNSIL